MRTLSPLALSAGLLSLCASTAHAQSNMIPGLDVELGLLDSGTDLNDVGRTGAYPNGVNGFAMSTTSCNPGSVQALWEQAMDPDHPFIAFMILREEPGSTRLTQISNYSYVKHGFFALSSNQCGYGCSGTNGTRLGIGCSDTYGVGNNGDRNWLAPAEEVDPWLGAWNPVGSLFDGVPVDGNRSYNGSGLNGVTGRVEVRDQDLQHAGARYWYAGYYAIEHEPENVRENNQNSREFTATWTGSNYNCVGTGGHLQGTVLQRWSGATLNSNTNGASDGRLWVAHKVTGSGSAFHYEFAVHNRDNNRGVSEFRLPIGTGVNISNAGFHDIDNNAASDWAFSIQGNEVVWSTTTNPLRWNSVYNFWFDADSAPVTANVSLVQWAGGPGSAAVSVSTVAPGDVGPFTELCYGDGGDQMGCTNCPCSNNATPGNAGGCLNSIGGSARLVPSGTPSVAADSMHFNMLNGEPSSFAVLTSGAALAPNSPANPCFGLGSGVQSSLLDGLRCAVQDVRRHGARPINAFGEVGITSAGWGPPDGSARGLIAPGGCTARPTRYYQVIYRTSPLSVCMTGQNTSQAVGVTIEP